jgi:hypothetical protein
LPGAHFIAAENTPGYLYAPGFIGFVAITELAERDLYFGRPAGFINMGFGKPDGVPVYIPVITVVGNKFIAAYARYL